MPCLLCIHSTHDIGNQIFVRCIFSQKSVKIVFAVGEEAGTGLAVGGGTGAAAGAAEGLWDGGDDADLAAALPFLAVGEAITAGGFPRGGGGGAGGAVAEACWLAD